MTAEQKLSHLRRELRASARFAVQSRNLGSVECIERRCRRKGVKHPDSLRKLLEYLYLFNGRRTMTRKICEEAEPDITPCEKILGKYFKARTNGPGRHAYGLASLRAAQKARFRCQACGESDVRTLQMNHVNGRNDNKTFMMLCANCHMVKSRAFDFTGKRKGSPPRVKSCAKRTPTQHH